MGENGAPQDGERSTKTPDTPPRSSGRPLLFGRRSAAEPGAIPPQPPRPKKRREGALSAMSGLLSFFLVALVGGVFALLSAHHLLNEPGPLRADKIVFLPPGGDTQEILAQLESEGVIENPTLMSVTLFFEGLFGAKRGLRSGEYLFKQNISAREVIDELVTGRQVMHSITIPEGLTSEQIVQRLRESDVLAGDLAEIPKEGALLPETYKVARGFARSKLIAKMQEDQRRLIDQIWSRRAKELPFRTPFELVTLASIVEKETGKPEERPHVAAVFVNRLRKGMRLQSDPTIIYGLVGGRATLGHGITRAELEKFSPYNTYLVEGLPPGPIANPGRASLEAAANPLPSADLYFVADGTGGHVFAPSLDQHNRNVQHWRQLEKDKAAPPDAAPPALRDQHGEANQLRRLVDLDARHEDYPPGRTIAADDGATHRFGKVGPWAGMLEIGSFDDPTVEADPRYDALRPARAFFTLTSAQAFGTAPAPAFDALASLAETATEDAAGEEPAAFAGDASGVVSYPMSQARRAELRARAAKLGLSQSDDRLPEGVIGPADVSTSPGTPAALAATEAPAAAARQRRIIDASEGSPIDPLRDRSWDLTTAKTVPTSLTLR